MVTVRPGSQNGRLQLPLVIEKHQAGHPDLRHPVELACQGPAKLYRSHDVAQCPENYAARRLLCAVNEPPDYGHVTRRK